MIPPAQDSWSQPVCKPRSEGGQDFPSEPSSFSICISSRQPQCKRAKTELLIIQAHPLKLLRPRSYPALLALPYFIPGSSWTYLQDI